MNTLSNVPRKRLRKILRKILRKVYLVALAIFILGMFMVFRKINYVEPDILPKQVCYTWFSVQHNSAVTLRCTHIKGINRINAVRTDMPLIHDCKDNIWEKRPVNPRT